MPFREDSHLTDKCLYDMSVGETMFTHTSPYKSRSRLTCPFANHIIFAHFALWLDVWSADLQA